MYEDKTLICKECGAEFIFTAGEQEFYAERVSKTSPSVARAAATPANPPRSQTARFTSQCAQTAVTRPRSRSNRVKTVRFTAANVLLP